MLTIKAFDESGNMDSCDVMVQVSLPEENTIATCKSVCVFLDENGDASIDSADVYAGDADNCFVSEYNIIAVNTLG